jgi:hypothetical protein
MGIEVGCIDINKTKPEIPVDILSQCHFIHHKSHISCPGMIPMLLSNFLINWMAENPSSELVPCDNCHSIDEVQVLCFRELWHSILWYGVFAYSTHKVWSNNTVRITQQIEHCFPNLIQETRFCIRIFNGFIFAALTRISKSARVLDVIEVSPRCLFYLLVLELCSSIDSTSRAVETLLRNDC